MRRRLTARRFADGLAAVGSLIGRDEPDFDPREYGDPPARLKGSAVRRPGRPRVRPPAFYAKFALRYEYIENVSRREPGDSTRELLARQYKVPLTTIGKWIRVARQRGFLTKVVRGQRGGQATRRAHDVNAREEKK
jgi:hypothetical protein